MGIGSCHQDGILLQLQETACKDRAAFLVGAGKSCVLDEIPQDDIGNLEAASALNPRNSRIISCFHAQERELGAVGGNIDHLFLIIVLEVNGGTRQAADDFLGITSC